MTETLAIIPAPGGPGALLPVAGRPLLGWAVGAARDARRVGRVVVSTDDAEVAAAARGLGAEVVERPPGVGDGAALDESAALHALARLEAAGGYRPDLVVLLACGMPPAAAEDVDGTIEALERAGADAALAVVRVRRPLWALDGDGGGVDDRKGGPRFEESGSVYVMKAAGFREAGHRSFGRTALHEVPADRRADLDGPPGREVAGVLIRARERLERASRLPESLGAIVFDFDGVFTDNRVWVLQDGREAVACSRGDGMGLDLLRKAGWPILVLSKEANPVVSARCAKLKLECLQGVDDKRTVLLDWLARRGVDPAGVVYLGNDVNDLPCLTLVGCPAVVADAHPDVLPAARLVLASPGGLGAIRELADLILARHGANPRAIIKAPGSAGARDFA